jgi:hypothetical protein
MTLPENLDHEKLAETALAILSLTLFSDMGATRAWKGMDWDLLAVLHQKGLDRRPCWKTKVSHTNRRRERFGDRVSGKILWETGLVAAY